MASLLFLTKLLAIKIFSYSVRLLDLVFPKNRDYICIGAPDYSGNSYYLFNLILKDKSQKFKITWLTRSKELKNEITLNWGKGSSESFLSLSGIYKYLRSRIIIVDHGASDMFYFVGKRNYRKLVINLWHGIPIKKLDGIMPNSKMNWDLMPVSSSIEKKLYREYNVTSKLPIIGMPRNQYLHEAGEEEITSILSDIKKYIDFTPRFIISYAPTYRHHSATDLFPFEDYNSNELIKFCSDNEILVIFRFHPNEIGKSNNKIDDLLKDKHFIMGNRDRFARMQELLLVSDFLITDYSGNYYDFLVLKKVTIFFPYDKADYEKRYGFATDYSDISSKSSCFTQEEFIKLMTELISNPKRLDKWIQNEFEKYHEYDPSNCVSKLIEHMISP